MAPDMRNGPAPPDEPAADFRPHHDAGNEQDPMVVRKTAIITGDCPQCEITRQGIHADPLARRIMEWSDVVITATECDHTTAAADETPNAPVRFQPPNSLVVDACPFCGKRHVHGAGAPAPGTLPDPQMYGYRTAHCRRRPDVGPRSYRLVPAQGDA